MSACQIKLNRPMNAINERLKNNNNNKQDMSLTSKGKNNYSTFLSKRY